MARSIVGVLSRTLVVGVVTVLSGFISPGWAEKPQLSLHQAITYAVNNDPWLKGSELNEKALLAESVAVGELPDPKLSIGLVNLATDTFNFDQEPMTQFKVGVAQTFPRGDSLQLRRRQKQEEGAAYPFLREDRKARVALKVTLLWLDTLLAQQSLALIEHNRPLFNQLVDITHANYITTSGTTRQQDVIRAELELTQLNDRLSALWQNHDGAQQALGEWLSAELLGRALPATLADDICLIAVDVPKDNQQALLSIIQQHPRLLAIDQNIRAVTTSVDLARQQYKPEWGINAAYGYRDDAPSGSASNSKRADFLSLGITVDLPLFTANRQDQRLSAATHRRAAFQTERDLALRELIAGYEKTRAELERLDERMQLYQQRLLPQMQDQADAALAAYTSDGGDFSEVMRARIAELNSKIIDLEINVKRQKMMAKMHYFVVGASVSDSFVDVSIDKNMERKK